METYKANINSLWGYLIINELARNGIDYFCISPGSRSTPLTFAAAEHKQARTAVFYDERGAAYHALGFAKACGRPAVLIATSGTAVANYFPAVVEASQDNIPLIILSADRPEELRNTGANQTIDQVEIFGRYPRWFFDLPCPDENIDPRFLYDKLYEMMGHRDGPVHLNCRFREPLEPAPEAVSGKYLNKTESVFTGKREIIQIESAPNFYENLESIKQKIENTGRGLLVVGRMQGKKQEEALQSLACKLGWPVWPDVASGLRSVNDANIFPFFDQLLLADGALRRIAPDVIVHFGAELTSKRFLQQIAEYRNGYYVRIQNKQWESDPAHRADVRIFADEATVAEQLRTVSGSSPDGEWIKMLQRVQAAIRRQLEKHPAASNWNEITIAGAVAAMQPEGQALFLGNSMPVRDMDMYGGFLPEKTAVVVNRGASGIDGNLATAAGYSAGSRVAVTVVLGDLAFIHDMNSLSQLKRPDAVLHIVLINNSGGGIFSFLPVARFEKVFEEFFITPHSWRFEATARQFNITYDTVTNLQDFNSTLDRHLKSADSTILEAVVDRTVNVGDHKALQQEITKLLNKILPRV